ncbi:MAG: NAD(P)/FAD-dependent oxidoreductase [Myxococcales bacterium]|nr:NAD(P)/FAD-dependent oxidoreductase [Myxococcales bacterium]
MNEQKRADIVIVGAGPAGTAAAAHLGQLGVKNVVLLDKHDFPREKTCGSGISPKGIEVLRSLGVWEDVRREAYPIHGLRLVTPEGREAYQSAGDQMAAVVCARRVLDHLILKRALDSGVEFVPFFTADSLIEEGGRVVGVRAKDGREVRARFTLVAGGTHCRLGPERDSRRMIQAIMGWWEGVPFRKGHVEMVFDPMVLPYYGWLFPESDERVNIGICYEETGTKRNARELFQQFLDKQYGRRLAGAKQLGAWKGHPVAYSYEIEKLTSPGRIVIGEAGLMTHPATAEGIYQGMKSGMIAAEVLRSVFHAGVPETEALVEYERRCKATFRLSFLGGGLFRNLVKTPALDWLVRASETPLVKHTAAKIIAAL